MKCMNCGKNEVNFYYTSNINGKVTKQQLCSECAEKLGYTQKMGSMFGGTERMMNGMFGDSFFNNFFERAFSPFSGFGIEAPRLFSTPWLDAPQDSCGCESGVCGEQAKPAEKENVDPELNRRREIKALRHQMHMAAKEENFEKAAELRDKLRKLENED